MHKTFAGIFLLTAVNANCQTPAAAGVLAGKDEPSGIQYVLISADGKLVSPPGSDAATAPPRLTAQCTKDKTGKLKFELLADLGGVPQISYIPPWHATSPEEFPPPPRAVSVTTEFLGYTKVKPRRFSFHYVDGIPDEMKYATPGASSSNMDPERTILQYLRSLPTLRLTVAGKGSAEYETTKWQQQIKAEPLCAASGL
jgi:hypothetical protein